MNLLMEIAVQYQEQTHPSQQRDDMPVFHERLKTTRISRGFTQEALADALTKYFAMHHEPDEEPATIAQSHVSAWEKGRFMPKAETLKAMSILLDVTMDYLLDLVDEPHSHLVEEGLSDQELLLVRRIRQNPQLAELLYPMLNIAPPTRKQIGSGKQASK